MLDTPVNLRKPAPTDVFVGQRIRMRRNLLKMSQEKLGESIGVTFQQVQKYEKGTNRVGASRLQQIADVLGVSPSFFFEAVAVGEDADLNRELTGLLQRADVIDLVRAFASIPSSDARTKVLGITKTIAALSAD